jgi:pimeloyl-ACP methyl ester carboxylesterase
MPKWPSHTVESNVLKINYYRTGGDKPPVIFSHGAFDDGLCWTRVAKALEADYDVVMVDARGHGMTESGHGDYSSEAQMKDLVGVIQALELDRPVIGGHSMGANTCLYLAAYRQDLIRGIFLEDPPLTLPGEPLFGVEKATKGDDAGMEMSDFMKGFKRLPKSQGIIQARQFMAGYPNEEIIPWLNAKKRVSDDFLSSMVFLPFVEGDALALFKNVTVPVLLIIGDKEKGSIVSVAGAEAAKKLHPYTTIVHLKDANHDIRRCKFDEYMQALQKFLNECYQGI